MLGDQFRTELLGLVDITMTTNTRGTSGIVDGNETLPALGISQITRVSLPKRSFMQ